MCVCVCVKLNKFYEYVMSNIEDDKQFFGDDISELVDV